MNSALRTTGNQNWPIVIFGFLALSLAFSARAGLGLVMPVWRVELGWSSSFVSGVGAAALVVMAIVAPFAGQLADRRGPRVAIIIGLLAISGGCALIAVTSSMAVFAFAFAGLCAIGFGIVATHVVSTAVARGFDRNQGVATGIATSGATGGQFLIVPLIAGLLAIASWRWSFAGLALASFMLVPLVQIFMRTASGNAKNGSVSGGQKSISADIREVLSKPAFHILFWSFLICGFTTTGVIETHLLPFASFCGFPPLPSATAYGLLSAVNLVGMIGAGWLTDRMSRPLLLASIYLLRALTFWMLANIPGTGVEALFVFAALFGAVDYGTVPVTASLVASHVGLRVMGLAMGMIAAGHAIGGAFGAFLGGYLFDAMGHYDVVWFGSLWLSVCAGFLVLLLFKTTPMAVPA